jgi:hypothetical protein
MPLPSSESGIHRLPISLVEILTPHVRGCQWGLLALLLASALTRLQPPRLNFGATFCCHVRPAFDTRHEIAAGDLLANLKVDSGFIAVVSWKELAQVEQCQRILLTFNERQVHSERHRISIRTIDTLDVIGDFLELVVPPDGVRTRVEAVRIV